MLFESSLFVIFTMYGGGFATIPAFLADMFGAAVVGPVIITELSDRAKATLAPGESHIHIYDLPLEVIAAFLAVGFVLTILVRPLRRS